MPFPVAGPQSRQKKNPNPPRQDPQTLKAETITQCTMPGERLAERETRVEEGDRPACQTRRAERADEDRCWSFWLFKMSMTVGKRVECSDQGGKPEPGHRYAVVMRDKIHVSSEHCSHCIHAALIVQVVGS